MEPLSREVIHALSKYDQYKIIRKGGTHRMPTRLENIHSKIILQSNSRKCDSMADTAPKPICLVRETSKTRSCPISARTTSMGYLEFIKTFIQPQAPKSNKAANHSSPEDPRAIDMKKKSKVLNQILNPSKIFKY